MDYMAMRRFWVQSTPIYPLFGDKGFPCLLFFDYRWVMRLPEVLRSRALSSRASAQMSRIASP